MRLPFHAVQRRTTVVRRPFAHLVFPPPATLHRARWYFSHSSLPLAMIYLVTSTPYLSFLAKAGSGRAAAKDFAVKNMGAGQFES